MNEVRIVGNDVIISVDEVVATIENAALIEDNKRLQAENERLRELVRTLYMCSNVRCDQCKYEHENTCYFDTEAELRELGVEV